MATVRKYRYTCTTEAGPVTEWREDVAGAEDPPTQCINDPAHVIDVATIAQIAIEGVLGNVALPDSVQAGNAVRVAIEGRQGSATTVATHNLCDRTTWYSMSVQHTAEAFSSTDDLVFTPTAGPILNWIDLMHGKVMDERPLRETYSATVYIDGAPTTPRAPFSTTGGDYEIDYVAGTITFFSSQAGKTITADFYRASTDLGGSQYKLIPKPGTILEIEDAEAQFSVPCDWQDGVIMEVVMWAAAIVAAGITETMNRDGTTTPLAESDLVSEGGSVPDNEQLVIGNRIYDTLDQIIDEARGAYPAISANGGSNGRANDDPREGFPFWYGTVRDLYSSAGMEMRICLENDTAFIGERATASFYCTSKAE